MQKNKYFYSSLVAIILCALIVSFGYLYKVYSSPGITTIGENISTGNITVSGSISEVGIPLSSKYIPAPGNATTGDVLYFNGTEWVRLGIGESGQVLTSQGAGNNPQWASAGGGGLAIFGDGSDGDVTISSDTTLTRDMYYNNLIINEGVVLSPDGYRIFVKETLTNKGTIHQNGNDGSGGTGGAAIVPTYRPIISEGKAGGNGGNNAAGSNGAGTSAVGLGATGGAGGSATNAGGAGGVSSEDPKYWLGGAGVLRNVVNAIMFRSGAHQYYYAPASGSGGGGGASDNVNATGGGGGGGAGNILIVAKTIDNSLGIISCNGGNGADGSGTAGNAGGGGGGGGGVLVLVYNTLISGTETANGGTGGAGYSSGEAGFNGSDGTVIKIANQ